MSGDATEVTRRTLLRFLCGGTALMLGMGRRVTADEAAHGTAPAETAAAFERMGRRYLASVPAERDRAVLAKELGMAGIGSDVLAQVTALEQAVRRDFERGDVLVLDAWILSRTELRAAALLALTTPAGG
jgi:hypothetical protein